MMPANQHHDDPAEADVTMYSKPACVQCRMTARALEKEGVSYTTVDLTQSETAMDYVQHELGYSAAPVVVVNADPQNHWAGFQPDKIAQVGTYLKADRHQVSSGSAPQLGKSEPSRDGPRSDPIAAAFPPITASSAATAGGPTSPAARTVAPISAARGRTR